MPQTWVEVGLHVLLLGGPPAVVLGLITIAGLQYGERALYRRQRAADCEWYAHLARLGAGDVKEPGRVSEQFEALGRKYRRAARYPWLPIEPD